MAFDAEAAKADGYTDEEIQAYLVAENQPTPQQIAEQQGVPVPTMQPIDRSAEYKGMAQGMGLKALETGAQLYAGKKLVVDPILGALRNRGAPPPPAVPTPPVTLTGGANPAFDEALSRPYDPRNPAYKPQPSLGPMGDVKPGATPPIGGPAAQQGSTFIQRMTQQFAPMAARVAPVLSAASRALPVAQAGMGLFYTSPEEIATLKAAEERRRRMGQ